MFNERMVIFPGPAISSEWYDIQDHLTKGKARQLHSRVACLPWG